jgi:hypothetical protein
MSSSRNRVAVVTGGSRGIGREAAARLRDGGAIVNFSTSVTRLNLPTYAAYAASKAAVEALGPILAKDLRGPNITGDLPARRRRALDQRTTDLRQRRRRLTTEPSRHTRGERLMAQHTAIPTTGPAADPHPSRSRFVRFTLIAAVIAAAAALLSESLGLHAWAMFVGWVAWFTRPASATLGLHSMLSLWAGMLLAVAGHSIVGFLSPHIGVAALPVAVFVLACVAVGMRTTPFLNNMLAWFLGLIAFFALHADSVLTGLLTLAAASVIGAAAGYACQLLQRRFAS